MVDSAALTGARPPPKKLSVCITTFNRAALIGETIESILSQSDRDCEIVIVDGGSSDGTELVVSRYTQEFDRVRYVKQEKNTGLDHGYERALELAYGEYCWFMTDDDLLIPGAMQKVLDALDRGPSLVVANLEFRDFTMSTILQDRWLTFDSDRVYRPHEMDRLFIDVNDVFMYIGSIIIRRSIWLARERESYYGSWFVHLGVIFQKPLPGDTVVIAQPLVSYRLGNSHSYKLGEIYFSRWPSLIESLNLTERSRRQVDSAEPWRHPLWLLKLRGWGIYSLAEYNNWIRPRIRSSFAAFLLMVIAILPGTLVNACFSLYYSARGDQGRWLRAMKQSRFHPVRLRSVQSKL